MVVVFCPEAVLLWLNEAIVVFCWWIEGFVAMVQEEGGANN